MAERPKGFGLTSELADKMAAKYDSAMETQAVEWMEAVTGEPLPGSSGRPVGPDGLQEALMDGQYICKVAIKVTGKQIKYNTSKMAFKRMENIGKFLEACDSIGVPKTDMFQTVDLYEGQNMAAVVNGIHALGRKAQKTGYSGPTLGPKEASANKREFTEEQLKAGEGVIGLQMGSNKGASQAGQSFGKPRHIID